MFTGIVTALGRVDKIEPIGAGRDMRLRIGTPADFLASPPVAMGASIACSGCCLTAVEFGSDWFAVDASAETLAHTRLGTWTVGFQVRAADLETARELLNAPSEGTEASLADNGDEL